MISSPIPVDPGYHGKNSRGQNSSSMIDTRPVPRVRPEAEDIATRAQGSVGLLLQLQGQPVYRAPVVRNPEPKNFSQENVRRMRKIQAMSRKKKAAEIINKNQPVKVLPQSEKYKEIQSKVAVHIQQEPPVPRPSSANYLRSYSRAGSAPPRMQHPEPQRSEIQVSVQGKNVRLEVKGYKQDGSQNAAPRYKQEHEDHRGYTHSNDYHQNRQQETEVKGRSYMKVTHNQRPQAGDTRDRSSMKVAQNPRPQAANARGRSSMNVTQNQRPQTADGRGRSSIHVLQNQRPQTADARGRTSIKVSQNQRPQTADGRGRSTSQDPQRRRSQGVDTRGRSTSQGPQQRRTGEARQRGRSPSPGPRPRTSSSSSDIDFIAHNARLARKHQPQRPPSALAQTALNEKRVNDMEKYSKGEVPKYLRERQRQWEEDEMERLRSIPDPEMPPGHRMMPRDERIKTLNILKDKEKELQLQLHKVPLNAETLRARTMKTEIETKIAEVEEAIKIFSRNKVFIKIDS
ncbi:uncharacterized protein [Antedon mediterranea]|uniref:uncharacterized protein n=1 Tax=Antedon mediterranea TaxID=105859 RepID=UPI003AF55C06